MASRIGPSMRRVERAFALACALALAPGMAAAEGRDEDPASVGAEQAARISAERAFERVSRDELLLVDIRVPEMWQTDGIPEGAFTVDWLDPTFFDQIDILTDGEKDMPIALICNHGVRTARAAEELAKRGYSRVYDVHEGVKGSSSGPGWIAVGLPMSDY